MKIRFAGMAAALLAAILFNTIPVRGISAEQAIVVDGETGRILYEKRADEPGLIASTTKIMTALIVCEQSNVLDRVRIPKEAVGIEGSSMYLREDEVLTVQELLYGLMLQSGNDAAVALAIYCGGTVEGFVQLMNDKAHRLGLEDTHFANPNGLDAPGHYSTPGDLAKLAIYAMKNPIFKQTVSTKTVKIGERYLRNHNKLLWMVEGADGVKTGFTKAAGRILVSSAQRDGRRLVAVTFNAPNDWQDHRQLLEQGFSDYTVKNIVCKGQVLGQMSIVGGCEEQIPIISDEDFSVALRQGEQWHIELPAKSFEYAPVSEGQDAGIGHVFIDDAPVGSVRLVYGKSAEPQKSPKKPWWKRIF
ncbi:MAG: D-alanyl-D-alanine carboxypeptidase [Oscillospiraceae bacterium]|nr:D-alanyl-D-alanine carboxypeptidase [Oscillospiraceae bacterium]